MSQIMHPKKASYFKVKFVSDVGPSELETVQNILTGLDHQTVAVDLPMQVSTQYFSALSLPAPGKKRQIFKPIYMVNDLKITVEDDVTNKVAEAIELCQKLTDLHVVVMKLDGADGVLEAFLFTNAVLMTAEHTALDYRVATLTAQPGMPTSSAGTSSSSSVQQTINIIHPTTPQILSRKLSFKYRHSQYYRASKNSVVHVDIDGLLGDI